MRAERIDDCSLAELISKAHHLAAIDSKHRNLSARQLVARGDAKPSGRHRQFVLFLFVQSSSTGALDAGVRS
jgi:hypothetical protein